MSAEACLLWVDADALRAAATYLALGLVACAAAAALRWALRPLELRHAEPGFAEARAAVRRGSCADPSAFPTGWYVVARSDEVGKREVVEVVLAGRRIAVFRGTDLKVRALDAFCAHLGANMARGDVIGNRLRCPFHHWSYEGDGRCTSVPYAKPSCIPKEARVESWHVLEQDDQVMLWYAARPGQEPHWRPTICNPNKMPYRGGFSVEMRAMVRSVTENSADTAHFQYVHANTWKGFVRKVFHTKWVLTKNYETDGPFATISVDSVCIFLGFPIVVPLRVKQLGPGIANISVSLPFGAGRAEIIQCAMPGAQPDHLTLTERVYGETWFARFIAPFAKTEVCQDATVWNNQSATSRPVLVPQSGGEPTSDATLAKYRRWFAQFEGAAPAPAAGGDGDAQWDGAARRGELRSPTAERAAPPAACAAGGEDW